MKRSLPEIRGPKNKVGARHQSHDAHKGLVLLSGGLDSAANLVSQWIRIEEGSEPVEICAAVTFDYGQISAHREQDRAQRLCEYFGLEHLVLDARQWTKHLSHGGALLGEGSVPQLDENELDQRPTIEASAKAVWVPNRNGVFLNLAASLAESRGWDRLFVGFNLEEASTFPDNTLAFLERANDALHYSTANHVKVRSWTAPYSKAEIVSRLESLNHPVFPFHLLWSCYHGGALHCGRCESCGRLRRALTLGLKDQRRWREAMTGLFGSVQKGEGT